MENFEKVLFILAGALNCWTPIVGFPKRRVCEIIENGKIGFLGTRND